MLTVLNYKSLARFKQDVIGMLDKNSQNDTSNASKRIICLYRKHIGPRIKQKVDVYKKYFHAEPLVCGTTEKYIPTRTPTPLP